MYALTASHGREVCCSVVTGFSPTLCACVVGIERDVNPGRCCASTAGRLSSPRVYNQVFLRLRRRMHLEAAKISENKN